MIMLGRVEWSYKKFEKLKVSVLAVWLGFLSLTNFDMQRVSIMLDITKLVYGAGCYLNLLVDNGSRSSNSLGRHCWLGICKEDYQRDRCVADA